MISKLEQHFKRLPSGAEAKLVSFLADELKPVRLNLHAQERANEWAHHFTKTFLCSVRVWALPNVYEPIADNLDPEFCEIKGETFFSLRSLLVQLLKDTALDQFEDLQPLYRRLISTQMQLGELALAEQRIENLPFLTIFVGQGGSIRTLGRQHPNKILLNAHYFAITEAEFDTAHTILGDCAGLWAKDSVIAAPLLTPRCTLFKTSAGWQMRPFNFAKLQIQLPDGSFVHEIQGAQVFRRGFTSNGVTPGNSDVFELVLVERQVVAMREGGGRRIPYGGLVVSLPQKPSASLISAFRQGQAVSYSFKNRDIQTAIQVGPQLIRQAEICIEEQSFEQEAFFVERNLSGTIPYRFPADTNKTHASRSAVGINAKGQLIGLVIEGGSSHPKAVQSVSQGATLLDLAHYMLELGAVEAMNLDGGGSTQLFAGSGALIRPADKRGIPFASYERLVPSALVFS